VTLPQYIPPTRSIYGPHTEKPLFTGNNRRVDLSIDALESLAEKKHISYGLQEGAWLTEASRLPNMDLPFDEHTLNLHDFPVTDNTKEMLQAAHEAGAYTCGDVIALGSDNIRTRSFSGSLDLYGMRILEGAIRSVTGVALQEEQIAPQLWPAFYDDLRRASPAISLSINNPYYNHVRLAATGLIKARATMGNLVDPQFMDDFWQGRKDAVEHKVKTGEITESDAIQARLGVHSSREIADEFTYRVVEEAIDGFDKHVRKPRLKGAHAIRRHEIDEARNR
jgi:hypothetical protein